MRSRHVGPAVVGAIVALLAATPLFAQQRWGEKIDPKAPKVTLAQLIATPDQYAGKTVVVDGTFAGKCGDGDFYFKDKFDMIEADPPSPDVCLLKKSTKVRLFGLVKVRHAAPAKPGGVGDATVRISAKGVEVLK